MPEKIKNFYTSNPWTSRFIITVLVIVLLITGARIALSPAIIYATNSWLQKQGINSSIEDININIFDGTVSLINARGRKQDKNLFNIGLVDIRWQWAPLSEKIIQITGVTLDRLDIAIARYQDQLTISGINIPLQTTASNTKNTPADSADEDVRPWAADLGEVVFTRLNICYLQHLANKAESNKSTLYIDYCVTVDEMAWHGSIAYARDESLLQKNELPVSSTGSFQLKGLKVVDNRLGKYLLTSQSNTLNNVVISGLNNIHIDEIDMNRLSLLQRDDDKHRDAIRFTRLNISDIQLSNLDQLSLNNIRIDDPGLYIVKHSTTDWEYQQWLPQGNTAAENTSRTDHNKTETGEASAFSLAIKNTTLSNTDWCYQDNSTQLYYCLTFEQLNWQGAMDYNTVSSGPDSVAIKFDGDLALTKTLVQNHSINRALLRLSSLKLDGIKVNAIDDVALQKLSLSTLAALQRKDKADDNTLAFGELTVRDINYRGNGIKIDDIRLTQLQSQVSRNSDGSWEHDKWRLKDSTSDKTEAVSSKPAAADSASKPFAVSLNTLEVTTDKKIGLTDNSTSPPMNIGLQKLSFDLSKLYSDKPDNNSLFKLFAKTTRHGTIDLEGTIKPFAKKLSFNARGKLKGFDLRAATPATRKAIGHIIQSGQLDADLDLVAVDGILDSNISLSLYQFHIKALNKKDAEKLDKEFGMPLNKTLVLLRDKDGSIHLDIPITGDVNNPDFDPMDAIITATSKAATVTLITFYTPYGLAYAGGNILFDLATALSFDPIDFAPGSAELTEQNTGQLDKLATLLTEKPQIHLTLCGITGPQDTYSLYPELSKASKDEKPAVALSKEQQAKLKQIAKERQVNSKKYLVSKKGIAHDRLILCTPEHRTDEDTVSGVEIEI